MSEQSDTPFVTWDIFKDDYGKCDVAGIATEGFISVMRHSEAVDQIRNLERELAAITADRDALSASNEAMQEALQYTFRHHAKDCSLCGKRVYAALSQTTAGTRGTTRKGTSITRQNNRTRRNPTTFSS